MRRYERLGLTLTRRLGNRHTTSKAHPGQEQDWILKCLRKGGGTHPLVWSGDALLPGHRCSATRM
jgi:hypothetical protein